MDLGLKQNEVRLVPYNSDWQHEFEEVRQAISQQTALTAERIEHIGSTAMADMPAKPVIDLLIGVDDLEAVSGILAELQTLGFYRLKVERPGEIVLAKFTDKTFETKTHFLHLVKHEDELWHNLLFFRDYLRAHKKVRDAYAELKLAFTQQTNTGINEYTDHKEAFVKSIVAKRGRGMNIMKTDCLGCRLANEQLPIHKVYEDAYVTAFLDHDPFNEGHALILPKTHCRFIDDFDEATSDAVMQAARLLSRAIKELFQPDGITLCQNGGTIDDLTHFHLHVVPRKEKQPFASFYTDEPWDNEQLKEKLPETQEKLTQAIQFLLKNQ